MRLREIRNDLVYRRWSFVPHLRQPRNPERELELVALMQSPQQ
jgi:hypothetical protein